MKNLTWLSGLLVIGAVLVGCAEKKNDPAIVQNPVCPVNTYYSNGACYSQQGYPTPSTVTLNNGFYADNHSGTSRITIVNSQKMQHFFKYGMGLCDRVERSGGYYGCDAYAAGYLDIIIQFPPAGIANTMMATIIAYPRQNQHFNYGYQIPSNRGLLGVALGLTTGIWLPDPTYYSGAYRNPLQLQMQVSAINNSAGFEARGYGDYWTGLNTTVLAIQVPQGKVQDNSFNFNFLVQGTTAAQGVMTRCKYPNCGL